MNTETTSILSLIPENLHAQLTLEVLQKVEADKANNKETVSPMFQQVMDEKKKEKEIDAILDKM